MAQSLLIRNPFVHIAECVDAHGMPPKPDMPWLEQGKRYEVGYVPYPGNTFKIVILSPEFADMAFNSERFKAIATYCLN